MSKSKGDKAMKQWMNKSVLLLLLLSVAYMSYQGYGTYETNKENEERNFWDYYRMESSYADLLSIGEAYIVAYPLEGMHSQVQIDRRIHFEELKTELPLRYELIKRRKPRSSNWESIILYRRDDIVSELNLYFNHFETDKYPASEANLKYMNNLLLLMQELRFNVEANLEILKEYEGNKWFNTEQFLQYQEAEKAIHEKNNWVIKPTNSNTNLGYKTEGVDEVLTPIDTVEKAKEIAFNYLVLDYPELTMETLEASGYGESNVLGRLFKEFEFEYNDTEINVQNTGQILEVFYRNGYKRDDIEVGLQFASKKDQEKAIEMAKEYMELHGYEKYSIIEERWNRNDEFGFTILPYTESSYKNRKDRIEIRFRMIQNEIILYEVELPQLIYLQVMQTNNYELGLANEMLCRESVDSVYEIVSSNYRSDDAHGNQLSYSWNFEVHVGESNYLIEVDALTFEIESLWPKEE